MLDDFLEKIPRLKTKWNRYKALFSEVNVRANVAVLREGEIPRKIFFVKKGFLRAVLNSQGKEITFQFFFENDMVASMESFRTNQRSPIGIKTVEPSTLIVLHKDGFEMLLHGFPEFKDFLLELASRRFTQYSELFVTYIRTNPRQRYLDLLKSDPRIVQRVPQKYIASFLGITPVSLSRIRKRI
jgi:CRP-like cAMP-binding protein